MQTFYGCEKCKTCYPSRTQAENCEESHCDRLSDVADTLHKWMCHENHTDGCDYHYETQGSPGNARGPWLIKAGQLLAFARANKIDMRTLMQFLKDIVKD